MCRVLIGTAILAVALGDRARADEQADARAVLDAGIKAQGGDTALGKIVGVYIKWKGTSYEGEKKTPASFEQFYEGFDKVRTVSLDEDGKVAQIEVINGRDVWVKDADQPTGKLEGGEVDSRREFAYVMWATNLVPLKDKEFRLSPLDEITIAGRKAVGILVSHDKRGPLKFYFDKETHLFVEYERKVKDPDSGKEIEEKCVCSDYRDVQDTKQPFKAEVFWDGAKVADVLVAEMKLYDKPLDEKLFAKP